MARQTKLGDRTGVAEWRDLATIGDLKRFFAWAIHSVRNRTLDPKTAAIMAQIGSYTVKAIDSADLSERLDRLERATGANNK